MLVISTAVLLSAALIGWVFELQAASANRQLTAQLAELSSKSTELVAKNNELTGNLNNANAETSKAQGDLSQTQQDLSKTQGNLDKTQGDLGKANQTVAQQSAQIASAQAQLDQVNKDLTAKKAELDKATRGVALLSKLDGYFATFDSEATQASEYLSEAYDKADAGDYASANSLLQQYQVHVQKANDAYDQIQTLLQNFHAGNY